jgi:hypothetical protein
MSELSPFQKAINDLADTQCYCGREKEPGCIVCRSCFAHGLSDSDKRLLFKARNLYIEATRRARKACAGRGREMPGLQQGE